MSEAHSRSSLLVICLFFAAASSSAMMAATTHMLETSMKGGVCEWEQTDGRQDKNNQSCYLFPLELKSFYQANKSCIDKGAHLVSIANKDEDALVKNLTKMTVVWIGLYRLTNELCAGNSCTTWMWLDGSGVEYDAWTPGLGRGETQCVLMNTAGTWEHGRECSTNLNFVCEKSIPPSTSPEPTTMAVTGEMTDSSVSNSATWGHVGSTPKNFGSDETDHFSIFMGVGVFVGVFTITIIIGAVVCVMKRRQGRLVKTSKVIADRDASTDMGNYENVDMSVSSQSLVISELAIPDGVYVNSFTTDSTISTRNHEDDTTNRTANGKLLTMQK